MVQADLLDLDLQLNTDQIASISKSKFKLMVKEAAFSAYFFEINQVKDKLSKGRQLFYNQLSIQPYLTPKFQLTSEEMKIILKIRLRDIPLKCNFPGAYSDRNCLAFPSCSGEDSNKHLFICDFMSPQNIICQTNLNYESIFGDEVDKQANIARIMRARLQRRTQF